MKRFALIMIDMQRGFLIRRPRCVSLRRCDRPGLRRGDGRLPPRGHAPCGVRHAALPRRRERRRALRREVWFAGGRPLSEVCPPEMSDAFPEEFTVEAGDYCIVKPRFSAFFSTQLDLLLRRLGVDTVILAGTTTPNCIRTTCYDALSLDYDVVVLSDCTSSVTDEVQSANLRDMARIGARICTGAGAAHPTGRGAGMSEIFLYASRRSCPLLLMILLGYLLRLGNFWDDSFFRQLNRFCFRVFLPVQLFLNVYSVGSLGAELGAAGLYHRGGFSSPWLWAFWSRTSRRRGAQQGRHRAGDVPVEPGDPRRSACERARRRVGHGVRLARHVGMRAGVQRAGRAGADDVRLRFVGSRGMENAADEHREKPADSRRVYGTCRRRDPGLLPTGADGTPVHAAVVAAVAVFCPAAVFEGRYADHACRAGTQIRLTRCGAAQEPDGRGVHAPDRLPVHHSGGLPSACAGR